MQVARRPVAPLAAALAAVAWGCSDSNTTQQASLTVLLTDAPSQLISSAVVEIGAIDIIKQDSLGSCQTSGTCEHVRLTDHGGTFDLLHLQNGAMATLADYVLEAGRYRQLRFFVDAASVTLAEGYTFPDGSDTRTLIIPSGAMTGIKINLGWGNAGTGTAGVEVVPGETVIVVDFDVMQNFRVHGDPESLQGILDVLFTPMLRAVVRDVAGSIAGVVTQGTGVPVAGAAVLATQTDAGVLEALQTPTASALTDSTGAYTIRFLAPGVYRVYLDALAGDTVSVTVGEAQAVTGINLSATF